LWLSAILLVACRASHTAVQPAPDTTRVSAGLVEWHASGVDAARLASHATGRPVLLFELFGELDQAFC
jgi:hypothetical protein